jgi:hypothetical protein
MSECTCSQIMLGTKPSTQIARKLMVQIQKRADRSQRLRDLYEKRKSL